MLQRINLSDRPAPAQFAEATLVPAGAKLLVTGGQVGVDRHGVLAADIETQTAVVWQNILLLLEAAGTTVEHVVQATAYLTDAAHIAAYRKVRGQHVPALAAPSTLLVVSGLANPGYLVEVEVSATVPAGA